MSDKEKVIKGLEKCIEHEDCGDCPYASTCYDPIDFAVCLMKDALALLKEKGPAEPVMKKGRLFTVPTCRKCGYFFPTGTKPNYCSNCGQAVKWDE